MYTYFRGSVSIREPYPSKFFHRLIFAVHFLIILSSAAAAIFFLRINFFLYACEKNSTLQHTPDPPRTEYTDINDDDMEDMKKSELLFCDVVRFCLWKFYSAKTTTQKKMNEKIKKVFFAVFLIRTRRDDGICRLLHPVHDANCTFVWKSFDVEDDEVLVGR